MVILGVESVTVKSIYDVSLLNDGVFVFNITGVWDPNPPNFVKKFVQIIQFRYCDKDKW